MRERVTPEKDVKSPATTKRPSLSGTTALTVLFARTAPFIAVSRRPRRTGAEWKRARPCRVCPLTVLNVPRVGQVHLFYHARLLSDVFAPGHETIEARLFSEDEIPWDEIAFRTVRETLEHYFADRRRGQFSVHAGDCSWPGGMDAETSSA